MIKFPSPVFFLPHFQFLPKQSESTARGVFPQVAKLILHRFWGFALLPSQLRRVGRAGKVVERRFAGGEGPANKRMLYQHNFHDHSMRPVATEKLGGGSAFASVSTNEAAMLLLRAMFKL